jgi:putative salt-induced outer membrane protein YdiY
MRFTTCALAALLVCAAARADEVQLRNGDKLTGTITEIAGGKLTIKTDLAGEVVVDTKDVTTFSTDDPVKLKLKSGERLDARVAPAATTQAVAIEPKGDVAIDDVKQLQTGLRQWKGSIVAGAIISRGNSESDSFNLSANAVRRSEDDRLTLDGAYYLGRQEDPVTGDKFTSVDNWFAQGKYDYFATDQLYYYGVLRIERDRIAGLDLRVMPGVGVGYQWVESPDFNFSTEAGISYVYEDYETGGSDEHLAARLAYHVDKRINEKVTAFHNLEYLPSLERLDDYNILADAGLRATLTEKMFGEAKVEWRYDATPAPGAENNDLRFILGVGWMF